MRLRALAAATASALLLLGAARGVPLLAWLVCAPLVAASLRARASFAGAAALGAAFALEFTLAAHGAWLAEAAARYFSLSRQAGVAAAVALCIACAVPLGALLGLGLRCAAALPHAWPIAASAAVWVAWEALTRMAFPYYPWIGLAATQMDLSAVAQVASLAGQGGLSLALATSGSALGYAAHAAPRSRARRRALALAVLPGVAAALYGAARLRAAGIAETPLCTLAAVDARIAGPTLPTDTLLERYVAISARAARMRPDAIVWPESALPRDPVLDSALLPRLRAWSQTFATTLMVGGPRTAWASDWRPGAFNSAFGITGDQPLQIYDKREPVPFAEAWPTRMVPRPAWLATEEVAAGRSARPMRAGGCSLGVLICFEAERPALAFGYAAAGVDALVVLSNDAQLPARAVAAEVAESRLRAIETGLPVLRAANLGASVAIDRYGRVGTGSDGIVRLAAPAAEPAPAVRWAPRLLALCWLTAVATVIAAVRRGSRAR